MKRWWLYSFAAFLLSVFLMGFRVFPGGNNWPISRSQPKLWVEFCKKPELKDNDLPSDDPLSGDSITLNQALDSVLSDYNSVNASFVTLADADRDSEYNATDAAERTIDICFADTPGLSGGRATQEKEGSVIVGCDINLVQENLESAQDFIQTLTHELGHCLGFGHPQAVTDAVMSYFSDSDAYRLQVDDKAALAHSYPADKSKARQRPTFGASCATK